VSVIVLRAGAVEVDWVTVGRAVVVCLGSSTVLAAVTIVVEHRARLLVVKFVDRRRNGAINRLIDSRHSGAIVIWLVAVRCQQKSVDRRRIGTIVRSVGL